MRVRVVGDVAEQRAYLCKHGITLPPSDAGIANIADYIQQGGVTRNKIPPRKRIAEVKAAQNKWIGQKVIENGSGKVGIVKYLLVRQILSAPFDKSTKDREVFLAIVYWDRGGCSTGMSVNQLSLATNKTKTLTKASV